jgi:hypothetical protein
MRSKALATSPLIVLALAVAPTSARDADDAWLQLTRDDAVRIGESMRRTDRVGSRMAFRGMKTDRAINYKMRATWLTPEVIRATARLIQINERLSPERARALVTEAEAAGDTVVLIELDPNEGSGVVPSEWTAVLQPKGLPPGSPGSVQGTATPGLRTVRALAGVSRRDYAYDAFWVVFPLTTDAGSPIFDQATGDAELIVNIRGGEGIVSWPLPESVRQRIRAPRRPAPPD